MEVSLKKESTGMKKLRTKLAEATPTEVVFTPTIPPKSSAYDVEVIEFLRQNWWFTNTRGTLVDVYPNPEVEPMV